MESRAIHAEMRFREAPGGKMVAYLAPAFAPSTSNPEMRNIPKVSTENDIRVFSEQEIQDLEQSGTIPACSREILILDPKTATKYLAELKTGGDEFMFSSLDDKHDIHIVGIIRAKELTGNEPSPAGLPVITDMRKSVPDQPFLPVHINGNWDENTWLNQLPDGSPAKPEAEESPSL